MKQLTKKILEAGLVEANTVHLMEKWGQVERGSSELVGSKDLRAATENTLTKFAEEIEALIEKEREELRESRLAFQVGAPFLATWVEQKPEAADTLVRDVVLFKDNMGNFLFPIDEDTHIIPGAILRVGNEEFVVLQKEKLFVGEQPYTIQVRVDSRAG